MKVLLPAATSPHQRPTVGPAARTAPPTAFFAVLVCLFCAFCLACLGAQGSAETALAEPPGVEEVDCEGDDDFHVGSSRSSRVQSSRWKGKPRIPVDEDDADSGTPALNRDPAVARPFSSSLAVLGQPLNACRTQTFLAAVLPRGPTSIS